MAQHPFLKSIRPVNLLSFGPNTGEIELRPLNILIGPNGCGKSNLIEIVGLLSKLPDRDPWSTVIQTGGAPEWIWKGRRAHGDLSSLAVEAAGALYPMANNLGGPLRRAAGHRQEGLKSPYDPPDILKFQEKRVSYNIELRDKDNAFEVVTERFQELDRWKDDPVQTPWFERTGWNGIIHGAKSEMKSPGEYPNLAPNVSVLSVPRGAAYILPQVPKIQDFAEQVERFAVYRDWVHRFAMSSRWGSIATDWLGTRSI